MVIDQTLAAAKHLSNTVDELRFEPPVAYVYNPLVYAWKAHEQYIRMLNPSGIKVLFLGMNPGPWGMAQTGVPFGQVAAVKNWLGINAVIGRPKQEHPKRPILGYQCPRSEVSGQRLWGLFQQRFQTRERFLRNISLPTTVLSFLWSKARVTARQTNFPPKRDVDLPIYVTLT